MARNDNRVVPSNKNLWETCKREAEKKHEPGSPRVIHTAAQLYKDRGGEYSGLENKNSSLTTWRKKTN